LNIVRQWNLFQVTRTGLQIRAVVDRRELSELASINADRVSGLSWALGCGLAGLTGVLLAPQVNLDPFHFTLLVFDTFSIAVVARLVSLPIAPGAGATLALVAVVAPFFLSRIRLDSAQRMLALTVVFISIVCITGFCGYITLGQAAFAGTGAYVSARVANAFGLPVIVAMLIGGLGA